ncbi:MAG: tRNA (adenosine(37)-N6)-threonylcarbamoyltransferase complex ATPase subunit type 1 TsaE [Candidatus Peregrinibacteria bacterium]|nr:tRNA (adenosine(37)-N6)-threonylcarbamoyltransferase complex ATPase subunit type 1 TsaE [Candidatus Peregrinibacteria bacterium]
MKTHTSKSTAHTHEIASKVLKELPKGNVLCLYGQLGAGKTTFTKGIALAMGITDQLIKSPTYTYVREIESQGKTVFHCDLYRLEGKASAANEIVTELMNRPHDLMIIEWAEYLEKYIPQNRTDVHLKVKNETSRDITVHHHKK